MNRQLSFQLPINSSYAREDFVISDANRHAFNHLAQYPDWPSPLALIVGPEKTGKTHLASIFAARTRGALIGADVEQDSQFVKLASSDENLPLVIDDIDRTKVSEAVIFHTLNAAMRSGRGLLMTASVPVDSWAFKTNDLKSRARLAVNLELSQPDDAQISQMFVKLLSDRQLRADMKTLNYLLTRMDRSAAAVVEMVGLLDELSLSQGRAITRPLATQALELRQEHMLQATENERLL